MNNKHSFQALLAYDDTTMAITFRSEKTVKMLDKKRKRIEEMGGRVIISNFRKVKEELHTTERTVCELDFEVENESVESNSSCNHI